MQCWKCGTVLDDDSLFCTECGVEQNVQPEAAEEIICPRCFTPMGPGNKVCPVCGYEPKQKKKINKALIVVPLIVLIAAAGVGVGDYLIKKKPWQSDSGSSGTDAPDPGAIEILSQGGENTGNVPAGTDPLQQPVPADPSESADFWNNALDAVSSRVTLTGTLQEDAMGSFILALNSVVNVCAFDENGAKSRVDNITQITLHPGDAGISLSGHNGDVIEVTGEIRFQGQSPHMGVYSLNVIQAAVREEDIHRYEIRIEDCTWEDAYARCRAMGGYLVRINSLEEFNFITQQLDSMPSTEGKQFYIGARRDIGSDSYYLIDENNNLTGSRLDNGNTSWLDSIWLEGEPSYRDSTLGIDESYVSLFRYGDDKHWVINDIPNDLIAAFAPNAGKVGYICEMTE